MIDLSGYKLTFSEEFNDRDFSQDGDTTWKTIRPEWRIDDHSDIGFGRSSFVDPSSGYDPFEVSGGALSITAVPDQTPFGYPGSWESGLIHTRDSFSQTYGYFEIRADLADGDGAWNAFWLLRDEMINTDEGWQELDIVENYGVFSEGIYSHIHTTDPRDPIYNQAYGEADTSGFHTYGMEWGPEWITFYFDGEVYGHTPTPDDMHGPMFLLLNLAVQEPADILGVPLTMEVDYVRVYSNDPNAVAVEHGTVSSPDGYDPGLYGATAATSTPSPPPTPTPEPPPTPEPTPPAPPEPQDVLSSPLGEIDYSGATVESGTGDGEVMTGTYADEVIRSLGGDDRIKAKKGDDILEGGNGNDKLFGSHGADILRGGDGNDFLNGGSGLNLLEGGDGRDRFFVHGQNAGDPVESADGTFSQWVQIADLDFAERDWLQFRDFDELNSIIGADRKIKTQAELELLLDYLENDGDAATGWSISDDDSLFIDLRHSETGMHRLEFAADLDIVASL